jgi:hypothetical protein
MQHNKVIHLVIITGALLSLLLISATYSNSAYAQTKFRAKLDSNNEVPPVDSTAEGVASFKLKDEAIQSKINITGIADVSGAQILMGTIGQNGDSIVDLLKTGDKIDRSDGVSIKGNFTASDFEGSLKGKDLSALQSAMATNQTYVNIMTTEHPNGEIAGLIKVKGTSSTTQDITDTGAANNNGDGSQGVSGESNDNNAGDGEN